LKIIKYMARRQDEIDVKILEFVSHLSILLYNIFQTLMKLKFSFFYENIILLFKTYSKLR